VNVQGCGARTNIAVMVIRLDAKPRSAPPQQKYPAAAAAQVRQSRDHLRPGDVTAASSPVVAAATVITTVSTPTAVESASSNTRLTDAWDHDSMHLSVSVEALSKGAPAGAAAPPVAVPVTRPRFVKKTAGARDRDVRQSSPSASVTSGVNVQQRPSTATTTTCDDVQQPSGSLEDAALVPAGQCNFQVEISGWAVASLLEGGGRKGWSSNALT